MKDKYIYLASFLGVCLGALVLGSNSAGRWIGSLGEPNALAAVIVFIFPFVFLNFKQYWLRAVFGVLALIVINFTESRSALIGLSLELLFFVSLRLFKSKILPGVFICSIIFALSLFLPLIGTKYFLQTTNNPRNYQFEDRSNILQVALVSGFNSPIYGSGIESIQNNIHETAKALNSEIQYQVIDSAHNILLDYWIQGGGIGVILLVILVVLAFLNQGQYNLYLEAAVLIGLIPVLSFNPMTASVLDGFWWVLGRSFVKPEE